MSMLISFGRPGSEPEILKSSEESVQSVLGQMSPALLIDQNYGLQGAIAALNYMISNGCTEDLAKQSITSLLKSIQAVGKEGSVRVKCELERP
ncbi:MAG: hypothetical protein V4713_03850 [Pseudomonadota bacterium]